MTVATGIGSLPGVDAEGFDHALHVVLEELPDLPHLPELPGRGAGASMTGRALGLIGGLAFDLQPAGWRLTGASGRDQRRARSLLSQDLDAFEEQLQGYGGRVKVQVAGPWTLAATVEKPRGDKVLSDHGARRELAEALAEGVRHHLADLRRRLPDADLVLQVDEPVLAAVLAGQVPTASGLGRHRVVQRPEASAAMTWVVEAAREGARQTDVWFHSCAPDTPLDLLRGTGASGLSVDLSQVDAAGQNVLAEALEAGETVALGVVPTLEPDSAPSDSAVSEGVLRWLDKIGLDPEAVSGQLVVTPTCGLAGASAAWVRRAMVLSRQAAANLSG